MGAADLLANGKDVAVIDYHTGDTYANTYSNARLSYYNLGGTPTAWFDGGNVVVGGSHTVSMYPNYLPKYNLRKNIQSSFAISVTGSNSGLVDYDLEITIEKVATTTATNIAMHVVVTESDIQQSWQGMSELNHVERLMAPNQNGTTLDFSSGDILVKNINFSLDQYWAMDNCEVIIFLQNTQNKEVLQAIKRDLSDFGTTNMNDASIKSVQAPNTLCKNSFIPVVEVANFGLDNLTSLDVTYFVNNEPSSTYNWTGNLSYLETEMVELPEVSFSISGNNSFTVEAENPNGQPDEYPSNNIVVTQMDLAESVTSPVSLALKLDGNPEEISWEVLASDNTILYSGGNYTQSGQYLIETFQLNDNDCYSFNIYDEGGDGITGVGFYKLVYGTNTIFAEGTMFGYSDQVQFDIGLTGMEDQIVATEFTISPNPVDKQALVSFTLDNPQVVNLKVYNMVGKIVEALSNSYSSGIQNIIIDRKNLESGIYFVQLSYGENILTKKVILK